MISSISLPLILSLATVVASGGVVPRATDYTGGTGQGTYYDTGLTSCGQTYTNSDLIVALSHLFYDTYPGATVNPNNNPVCGKKLTAHYQGKSVQVTVADRCTACQMYDLDFTPTAFQTLAGLSVGRISGVTWKFDDSGSKSTTDTSTADNGFSTSATDSDTADGDFVGSTSGTNSTTSATGSGTILNSITTSTPGFIGDGSGSVTHLSGDAAVINSQTNSDGPDGSHSVTTSTTTSTHLNSITTSRKRTMWARDLDLTL
ncbi:hypothetical protein GYMLUDRAFT_32684 [Collybiopsis luxurians FD-317 M1]|nr:hypothetical protein GYMLUDRAFT_32684 [Collybiopsis luxurians FD-317 M1]